MSLARRLLAQRHFALLICMAALLLKLLMPTGYMLATERGHITIAMCTGAGPRTMTIDVPVTHGSTTDHHKSGDHDKSDMPCAFSSLSAASLGAVDAIQLAALLAFVMAVGLTGIVLPAPSRAPYLRPPSRGPPAYL